LKPAENGRVIQQQEYWQQKAEEIKKDTPSFARRLFLDGIKLRAQGEYGRAVLGFLAPGQISTVDVDKNPTLKGNLVLTWDIQMSTLFPSKSASKLAEAQSKANQIGRERERANKIVTLQIQFQRARDQFNRLSQKGRTNCTDSDKKELIENFHAARQAALSFLELSSEGSSLLNLWLNLPGPFQSTSAGASTPARPEMPADPSGPN